MSKYKKILKIFINNNKNVIKIKYIFLENQILYGKVQLSY